MWQTDTVTFQTVVNTNNYGGITQVWSDTANTILCDVQDINKELVWKNWGFTNETQFKQVYDHTLSALWVEGEQVKFDNDQWWVKMVNRQMAKIGTSNHVFVILSKVVG